MNSLSVKGLKKAGDIIIPGGEGFPSFSESNFVQELPRISEYMNNDDREGFKALTMVMGIMPSVFIRGLLFITTFHSYAPGFLGAILRQINVGVKGVVFTLYYSNLDKGEIFKMINYETNVKTKLHEDHEMEKLFMANNPLNHRETSPARMFEIARNAQQSIANLTLEERLNYIEKIRHVILRRQEGITDVIQKETFKARTDIMTSEFFPLFEHLDFLKNRAKEALSEEKVPTPIAMMGKSSKIWFEPLGTVLIVSPWNYPFYQAIVPITCSFITGNATVYKPSEVTPLKGLVESVLTEAGFDPSWVQIAYGDGKLGAELIDQRPQKIFFTGSVGTGKKIMAQAAQYLIPVELELGGKDPMVVFEDVNVERAVKGAVWGSFTNAGQSCTSVERLYVQESIYEEFKQKLVAETKKLKMGVDQDGDADMGGMISERQITIVADLVQDALKNGAKLLTGEGWDYKSRFIPPMILEGTTHSMRINQEEIFGPVLTIMKFKDEAEAIKLSNDSTFGLSASVWSKDKERAIRVSRKITTGNISINNVMVSEGNHDLPFGGVKDSGIGRYKGIHGLRSFSNIKSVLVDADSSKIEANWYPYTTKKYGLFQGLTTSLFTGGLKKWAGLVMYGLPLESEAKKERN